MLTTPNRIEDDLDSAGTKGRSLHAHGTVLCDGENRRIGALIVLRDVTRLKHLENVRREFVANVSHELRTPITSIKGFVETILHEDLADKEQSLRFLHIVLKQANRLDAIIHDLLMLSRVERGGEEQTIELQPESLGDVLRSAVEMCEQEAKEKRIDIDIQCPHDLLARINAPLLEQAVLNLIDNAVKYSEAGSMIHVIALEEDSDVAIRVEDHGCGIAAKHLPRLFERFYRVDRTRSRELGGTGLGLAIVKHIVAAHKGSVWVDSTVGQGSTFYIHLPAARAAASSSLLSADVQRAP
jgi:two-component system phosphate regulon sensor histidine kinase PhoR